MKEKYINMSIETELSNENLEFFSYLIKEGYCLEHYERMANALIENGWIDEEGNIL